MVLLWIIIAIIALGGLFLLAEWLVGAVKKSKLVDIHLKAEIASVPEHIVDMEIFQGKLLLAPYLGYKSLKIYGHDIDKSGLHIFHAVSKIYESVYRIWFKGDVLSFSTEQPPEHWAKGVSTGFGVQKHFAEKGWALLGDILSNGKEVRGASYGTFDTVIEINDGVWRSLGPTLFGKDGKRRIVWCAEYFNGKYYVGTSPTDAYKEPNIGNIYRLDNTWIPIRGFDVGIACGGAVSCLAGDDRLFFGTYRPQSILILDEEGDWDEFRIGNEGEVAKIWKDEDEHIFAGGYVQNEMRIYQWDLKEKEFKQVYSLPISNPYYQWGVVGVCYGNDRMFVKYRDNDVTRIADLLYEEA